MTAILRFYTLSAVLFLCMSATSAFAQVAPYTDWLHDLSVAQKSQSTDDIVKLTQSSPELAQVWFYGYVYDLVNPAVPPKEQASIRFVVSNIAQALATKGPDFRAPQRVMERLNSEGIATEVAALVKQEEMWESARDNGGLLPPQILVFNQPRQAEQLFYRALFKAEMWRTKLGGRDQSAKFIAMARRLGMGFALAFDDLRPWRALSIYTGNASVPLPRRRFVEEAIGRALNAQLNGKAAEGLVAMNRCNQSVSKVRRGEFIAGLVMNGLAAATEKAGDEIKAITIREQLYAGMRTKNMPALSEVLQVQLLGAYVRADKRERARRMLEQLLGNQRKDDIRPRTITQLLETAAFFERSANTEANDSRVPRAIEYANLALTLHVLLEQDDYLNAYELVADREKKRVFHLEAQARLFNLVGDMHLSRAEYDKAEKAFVSSQTIYETKLAKPSAGRTLQLSRAQSLLEQGKFDALKKAIREMRAQPGIGNLQKAATHEFEARAAFMLGAYAPAFAHANQGLVVAHRDRLLTKNGKERIASLHAIAALTLEASGFREEALERWGWAEKFGAGFERARHQARLLIAKGEQEKAVETLEPFFESHARQTSIVQGCLLAGTSRADEARVTLESLTPQLSLPQYRRYQAAGYACLAQIEHNSGNQAETLRLTALSLRALSRFPSKAIEWKTLVLKARALSATGKHAAASDAYEKALSALAARQYSASIRGGHFFDFDSGPNLSTDPLQKEAAMAAAAAANKREKRRAEFLRRAVARARMDRIQRIGLESYSYDNILKEVADTRPIRLARTKKLFLALKAENPRLSERKRADLLRDVGALSAKIDKLTAGRITSAKQLEREYVTRLTAREGVSIYYLVSENAGFIVLDRGSERSAITRYVLPNAKRIVNIDQQVRALVAAEPSVWPTLEPEDKAKRRKRRPKTVLDPNHGTWKRLKDHARLLVPFMFDGNRVHLEDKPIELFLSAQLLRTPFDALVLDVPAKRQRLTEVERPTFFGIVSTPTYRIGEQASTSTSSGVGQLVYGRAALQPCGDVADSKCVPPTMIEAVNALVDGTDDRRKQIAFENAESTGNQRALVLGIPLHVANAVLRDGTEMFGLGEQANGVLEVVSLLPHWDKDTSKNEDGLLKFWGGLTRNGLQGLAFHRRGFGTASAASLTAVSKVLENGNSVIGSVREWMHARATSTVDGTLGGQVYYHPYYWAHWQILGAAGSWTPMPLEPPSADEAVPSEPKNEVNDSTSESPSGVSAEPAPAEAAVSPSPESDAVQASPSVESAGESEEEQTSNDSQTLVDPFAEDQEQTEKAEASATQVDSEPGDNSSLTKPERVPSEQPATPLNGTQAGATTDSADTPQAKTDEEGAAEAATSSGDVKSASSKETKAKDSEPRQISPKKEMPEDAAVDDKTDATETSEKGEAASTDEEKTPPPTSDGDD